MANVLGIENLKKGVKLLIDLGEQIAESAKDGFSWTDTFSFFDEAMQLPGVISKGNDIIAELKDITPEERQELYLYVSTEFDIPNDRVEEIVEASLDTVFSILALVTKFKKAS